jgi:hypothetical protein
LHSATRDSAFLERGGSCRFAFWPPWASALLAGAASADPIGPDCGTCQGSIYTLTYSGSPISTTATTETFRITLTIDTSGYNGGGSFLNTVAVKVSSMLVSATLFDAPGGVAVWNEVMGGLNSNGCSGSGSGFDCAGAASAWAPVPVGTPYQWTWDLEMPTGTLFTGPLQASIKARYVNGMNQKVGALVSENINLQVPEPGTFFLLGLGTAGLAISRRPRR